MRIIQIYVSSFICSALEVQSLVFISSGVCLSQAPCLTHTSLALAHPLHGPAPDLSPQPSASRPKSTDSKTKSPTSLNSLVSVPPRSLHHHTSGSTSQQPLIVTALMKDMMSIQDWIQARRPTTSLFQALHVSSSVRPTHLDSGHCVSPFHLLATVPLSCSAGPPAGIAGNSLFFFILRLPKDDRTVREHSSHQHCHQPQASPPIFQCREQPQHALS